jgi:hypothetical protein
MSGNGLGHFVSIAGAVDPLFTCESHPLNMKPFDFFSAQDARDRDADDPVFSRSPDHEVAVFAMEPPRKIVNPEPFFGTFVKELSNESALSTTMTIVVNQFRLVRLLIPYDQSCTCSTRQ